MKQHGQSIEIMQKNGGYATLGFLNQKTDFSGWNTKTPYATIRRIVQDERFFFKIHPGLWALNDFRNAIFEKFEIQNETSVEKQEFFTHSYYQGLLVELGNLKKCQTYIPAQDKNRKFLERSLGEISTTTTIFEFTYPETVTRAKSVDVIWFNRRKMPEAFFEVEHSTDFQNSFAKYCDLQDFMQSSILQVQKKEKTNSRKRNATARLKPSQTAYNSLTMILYRSYTQNHARLMQSDICKTRNR